MGNCFARKYWIVKLMGHSLNYNSQSCWTWMTPINNISLWNPIHTSIATTLDTYQIHIIMKSTPHFHRNYFSSRKTIYISISFFFFLEINTICWKSCKLNLSSQTPAIWTFSPLNPRHIMLREVPIQLHGPRNIYIYIYISFNKYRTSCKKKNKD